MTCEFNAPWPCKPCPKCRAVAEAAMQRFAHDVFFGLFDRDGYTASERKAQQRDAERSA